MKKDLNIVVVEPIHAEGIKILKRYGNVIQLFPDSTESDLMRVSGKADAFITRGFMKISEKVLRTAERLRVIGVHGVGVDHIDIDFAQKRGIQIVRTPSALAVTVAEFTIGLMLSLLRNIPQADLAVRKGQWGKKYSELIGVDLTGKTVGIIGLGTIGSEVARRLKAFNVEIVYHKRVRNHELEKQLGIKYVSLKRLLEIVDIISIHVPLTLETHHMISTKEFALMKHGVYIINTSRGAVIEEKALYEALVSRRVAGAALDVFEYEPICRDSQLIKLDRVILTPHLAASSEEALRRMSIAVAEEVIGILVPSKT